MIKRLMLCLCLLLCGLSLQAQAGDLPESRLTYLYVPACQSCAKVAALLDSLPEVITVQTAEGKSFDSRLVIERADISADPALAEALFARFVTPEDQQIVPSVYFGGRYLAGAESILAELPAALERGEALQAAPDEQTSAAGEPSERLSLGASLGSGLVAGLNPCALSMLILLLGSLLHLGRRSAVLAAAFLLSKLVTYFLIGLLLLSLLQSWNPAWLTLSLKIGLSALAGLLIVLNLLDAWRAHRGDYGKVRNQLPSGLRQRLQALIKHMAGSPHVLLAVVLLGVLVSLGEFLCAGQLYLATLLATINAGAADARRLMMLAVYCLAFIMPSALLTLVILRLRHTLQASDFIRRRMPLIKLLTALVLVLAIIYAWRV